MTERRGFRIAGRVQGVGFRWWARRTAADLKLSGTVRNEADGTVRLIAEGPADRMRELEKALREGPPGAAVTHLEEIEPGQDRLPERFTIMH